MYIFFSNFYVDLQPSRFWLYNIIRKSSGQEQVLGMCKCGRRRACISTQGTSLPSVTAHDRGSCLPGAHPPRVNPSPSSQLLLPPPTLTPAVDCGFKNHKRFLLKVQNYSSHHFLRSILIMQFKFFLMTLYTGLYEIL